ncbi:MAG: hypothetical protein O3A84_05325 [Proteobacteria bacterium]|nr:hypothetical protein [Pseudomonadota bacterium]
MDIALAVSYQTAFARTGGSGRTDVLARLVNSGLHHFSAALRGNPLNSSVYKDLGDFYFTQFRPVEAWLLWDFARNIDDKFGSRNNSDLVDQLESGLESNFPDYFR